jgi:hypothetical protein
MQNVILFVVGLLVLEGLIFLLLYKRLVARAVSLKIDLENSGEKLLLGPVIVLHATVRARIFSFKTYHAMALTPYRLVFRTLFGGDITVELGQITEMMENAWFAGSYEGRRKFIILTLTDGSKQAFKVKDRDAWMQEIRTRVKSAVIA